MLSAADEALAARDAALPGLATVLDPSALQAVLAGRFPALAGRTLVPTYLRYKPGTSCLAGFRADGAEGSTWFNVAARTLEAASKFVKFLERPPLATDLGPSRAVVADHALAISVFPDDRRLKALRRLQSADGRRAILDALNLPGEATLSLLRYRPERRLVARVDRDGRALAVVKFHRPEAFAAAMANATAFADGPGLTVQRRLAGSARFGAVSGSWLSGSELAPTPSNLRRVGQALAALHHQDGAALAPLTAARQRQSVQAMATAIAGLCPELGEAAQAVAARIAQSLRVGHFSALHGDFHLEQILDQGDRIALIDFDEAVRGPAAWDLGNFVAHQAVRAPGTDLADCAALLADGYRSSGGCVSEPDLAVQTALGLLRLATRPFRDRQGDWPAAVADLLGKAEAVLPGPGILPRAIRPVLDPALPHLEAALDPARAQAAFAAAGFKAEVQSAALVRHKPGKRGLVAYQLRLADGRVMEAFGKVRAKGADSRTFALQGELRSGGFGPAGHADARVAEPLALIPALGMWLQERAAGAPFTPANCAPERAARAIGALHASRIRPLKVHRIADELAILDARLSALAVRRPDWSARLMRLLDDAHHAAQSLARVALRPIHRDFYFDHILVTTGTLHLIDLDLLSMGDPALDIGNFTAHLIERSLREGANPSHLAGWQARFAAAACRGSTGVRAGNVRIYEWLSLLRLVEIAERMPERRASAEALLTLCEDMTGALPGPIRRAR